MIDTHCERAAVIAEARAWLRTPYHHMGRVKGAGVDCATLLAEIYARAGVVAPVPIPYYPPDWHLHQGAERYLGFVLEHAAEIAGAAKPADIALWRFGRCFSHGAIVVDWPLVIHAYAGKGCVMEDASRARWLAESGARGAARPRPVKFFRLKRWLARSAEPASSEAMERR